MLLRPTVWLKLTIIRLILAIIWPLILVFWAIICSRTSSVDLLRVMWCENVYWALF